MPISRWLWVGAVLTAVLTVTALSLFAVLIGDRPRRFILGELRISGFGDVLGHQDTSSRTGLSGCAGSGTTGSAGSSGPGTSAGCAGSPGVPGSGTTGPTGSFGSGTSIGGGPGSTEPRGLAIPVCGTSDGTTATAPLPSAGRRCSPARVTRTGGGRRMLVTVTQRRAVLGGEPNRGIGRRTLVTTDRPRTGMLSAAVGFPIGAAVGFLLGHRIRCPLFLVRCVVTHAGTIPAACSG